MELKIINSFRLRENAEISIYTHGMMGERYIEVYQTAHSGDFLYPGSRLRGTDAIIFEILQLWLLIRQCVFFQDCGEFLMD